MNTEDLYDALDFLESAETRYISRFVRENPDFWDRMALHFLKWVFRDPCRSHSCEAKELADEYLADAKSRQTVGHADRVCKDFCTMVVRKANQAVIDDLLESDELSKMSAIGEPGRPRADVWREICQKIRNPEGFPAKVCRMKGIYEHESDLL